MAAGAVYGPQITGVREDNQIAVERRPLQQRMLILRRVDERAKRCQNYGKKWTSHTHFFCSMAYSRATIYHQVQVAVTRWPAD
jgi:hypothetical protein